MSKILNKEEQELKIANKIKESPRFFVEEILGETLWSKQEEIMNSVRDNRKTTVRSSNSVGKTFITARIMLWFLFAFRPSLVLSTAPTERQVKNQLWRELRKAHSNAKYPLGGKPMKLEYSLDDDWFAIGFSTRDGAGGMEHFQGWHGENVLVVVDEASGVHPAVFEAIMGALASGGTVRLLYIGNPTRTTGDFHASFKDPSFNHIHISAFDVPNVKEKRVVIPGLATYEWVEDMKYKYGEDSPVYLVRVKGDFPPTDPDTLIPISLVESAVTPDREIYGKDELILLDPARFGDDSTAFVYSKGNYAKVLDVLPKTDTMESAGRGKRYLKEYPEARIRIDITGGLGAGIFDRLREQPDVASRIEGVNVSVPAVNKGEYFNLRTEGWAEAKNWLKDAWLEKSEYWYELSGPRYTITSRGQIRLESKDDMKKRGIRSPNVGDALALKFQRPTEGGEQGIVWI